MYSKNSKCLPGWEQFQSKAEQEKQMAESLGLYDPASFNPSGQEVSLKDRLASKLDSYQQKEYGLAPVSPPQPLFLVSRKKK
jgi:hypothetical protein